MTKENKKKETRQNYLKSEQMYRSLFHTMSEGFALHEIIYDKKGKPCKHKLIDVNPAFEKLTGYSADELRSIDWNKQLTPPEWRKLKAQKIDELNRTGLPVRFEKEYIRKDGTRVPVELLVHLSHDESGKSQYYFYFITDITERKATEQTLNKITTDLSRAQQVGNIGSWRLDTIKNILTWSEQNHRIFGISQGQSMTYETFLSTIHPDDKEYVDKKWKAALSGDDYDIVHRIVVEGQTKWVREKAYLEFDENNILIGGFGITQDITELKMYEEQIQNLAKFPEEDPFPVLRIKSDGTILYSNPPGEIFLKQWKRNISQKVPKIWQEIVTAALNEERYHVKKINCGNKLFSVALAPLQSRGYVNLYGRDITTQERIKEELLKSRDELEIKVKQRTAELSKTVKMLEDEVKQRIQAQALLKESEEKYRSLVEFSPEAVCVLTEEKITFANSMALKLMKASRDKDIIGKSIWDFIHPDYNDITKFNFKELLPEKNKNIPRESKIICIDGSTVEVEASWTHILHNESFSILIIFHDITERKLIERRKNTTNSLLELFISKSTQTEYLNIVVEIISKWSNCCCVGIRLINDENYIPYEAHIGFSDEFLELENNLCLNTDSCLCTRTITHKSKPQDNSLLTSKGSFCCNNTIVFLNSIDSNSESHYRNNCIKFGFKSLAVIPVYYRNDIIGAIHLADKEANKVPVENVEFLEAIAMMVGEAVNKFKLEESLRTNERRLLEAQRIAHLGNWEWNVLTNKIWWSDEVYHIFGVTHQDFSNTYEAFLSLVHPEDRDYVNKSVTNSLLEAAEYNLDFRIIRPDKEVRIIQAKGEVTYDQIHKPVKMAGTIYDITEQKQKEQKIHENQKQLRALTSKLQLVQEQERRRIAQDLHDSIGQILSFSARELKNIQKNVPENIAESIKEIAGQLNIAVEQTRTLSFDLSPSILYDLGFEVAIEDLVDKMFKKSDLKYSFKNSSNPKPLSDEIKIILYRSVRELLINSIKYSNASYINVSLSRRNNDICIKVEDDGIGFDVSFFDNTTQRKGFGLFSIRERLNHIGGQINISSSDGQGTKVTLTAPLDIKK